MKTKLLLFVTLMAFLVACTTSKTVVSKTADIDSYQYASLVYVMDYAGDASLMDLEVRIYDAVEATRLTMVGDRRIDDLTDEQKEKLLLVRFSATQNDEEAIVSVNFVDYMTGKPVASCRGAHGFGLDRDGDVKGAVKKVAKQIKQLFK